AQRGNGGGRGRRRRAQAFARPWAGNPAEGQADAGGPRRAPQSRDREVVAVHQVSRDQSRLMLKIWGRTNSVNVKKALWCAEELGLPYERTDAGLQHGVVDTPDYRQMNPN